VAEASDFERLLFEALERRAAGGDAALAEFLGDHPGESADLRAELERLERVGLLSLESGDARKIPERLGDFRLLRKLGEGGMGVVWEAEQVSLGRLVALKLVRPDHLWFAGARERFRREVEAVARLQHPGIVPVHTVGEEQGVPYFAMELLDGRTLADVLEGLWGKKPEELSGSDLGPFDGGYVEACLRVAREIAEALDHAHSRGIVHRDVKPSNIALTRSGRAMLFDFGLARSDEADRLTRSGSQPGSLPYMSPEQLEDAGAIDARTDVYSLGATLYEMLTLRRAFEASSAESIRSRILRGEFPRPRALHRRLAWDVETVVATAMERDPARRYASASDLARDLGNLLAHRPIEARRAGTGLRVLRWSQRHPGASSALLAAVPLALAGLAALAWTEVQGRRKESDLRAKAEEERKKVLRLSDLKRLQDLETEFDGLYPARPENRARFDAWLDRARALSSRLDLHRQALAELRQAETDEDRWQHEALAALIERVEAFRDPVRGLLPRVESSRAFLEDVEERTVRGTEAAQRWRPVISDLGIAPVVGLLPLGRDPRSGLWEFALLETGEPPSRRDDGRLEIRDASAMVFVYLPGGRFTMGAQAKDPSAPHYDPLADSDEGPVQEIELAPFLVSKFEMTLGQWMRATGENPSRIEMTTPKRVGNSPVNPVDSLALDDCRRALARLGLDIPTEAQWEYAARGGTDTPWWTGADRESLRGAANLADQAAARAHAPWPDVQDWPDLDDGWVSHAPVGTFAANPFGLHDVCGNVMEWCRDPYGPYTVPVEPGTGLRKAPDRGVFVQRGGAFNAKAALCRSSFRLASERGTKGGYLGLRPVLEIRR
jgi:formylglycine-generating enzyme required for sulfatase activity